jgi:hypothetical protein
MDLVPKESYFNPFEKEKCNIEFATGRVSGIILRL